MSLDRLVAILEVTARFGESTVQAFAQRCLDEWHAVDPDPGGASGPLSNAEKCRRYRRSRATPATPSNGVATPETTPETVSHGVAAVSVSVSKSVVSGVASGVAGVAPARDLVSDLSDLSLPAKKSHGKPQIDTDTAATPATPTPTPAAATPATPTPTPATPAAAAAPAPLQLVPKPPKKAAATATRAPASTDPSAPAWCRAHGIPEPAPDSESANFLDYWASRGRDAAKTDWAAAWRCRPEWTKKERPSESRQRAGAPALQQAPRGGKHWKVGE
jgi:hypothetical protein